MEAERKGIVVNVNARVRMRLTGAGMRQLLDPRNGFTAQMLQPVIDSGGVWEAPLWEAMHVFGPIMTMGFETPATVKNLIEILPDPELVKP